MRAAVRSGMAGRKGTKAIFHRCPGHSLRVRNGIVQFPILDSRTFLSHRSWISSYFRWLMEDVMCSRCQQEAVAAVRDRRGADRDS